MRIKEITFIEEPGGSTGKILELAYTWYHRNKDAIKIKSGIWGIKLVEEGKDPVYLTTLHIRYTGTPVSRHPQECIHEETEVTTTNPTCIELGKKVYTCKACGRIIKTESIPAIAHNITSWTFNNDATCVADGTESGRCTMCGAKYNRIKIGSKLGHDPVWTFDNNSTCEDDGTETAHCSRCGKYIDARVRENSALGHLWTDWVRVKEPTYEEMGLQERVCNRCKEVQSVVIPKLVLNISITTNTIEGMVNGSNYSKQLETSAPEGSPVTWSITSGSLPTGLTMGSDGLISGKPSKAGVFTFTVKAQCYSTTATKTYTVNVAGKLCTVTFSASGASLSETTRKVAEGSTIGTLPTPTKSGQVFGGWYTAEVDGLKVDSGYTISADVTLYARWGQSTDVVFGEATTQFNIHVNGDRTNYADNPYTLYHRYSDGNTSDLTLQTGIASQDGTNNMTSSNKKVTLYLKVTNNGAAGKFDIGFDCDSYVSGNDKVVVTRIAKGVKLGGFSVTVPYTHTAWVGAYNSRTQNRYVNSAVNTTSGSVDSGYAFTIKDIYINSGSYAILEVTFQMD